MFFSIAKIQLFLEFPKNKKGDEKIRPLCSFHNGIILIVNCLKSIAKTHIIFDTAKIFYTNLISNALYIENIALVPKR